MQIISTSATNDPCSFSLTRCTNIHSIFADQSILAFISEHLSPEIVLLLTNNVYKYNIWPYYSGQHCPKKGKVKLTHEITEKQNKEEASPQRKIRHKEKNRLISTETRYR